MVRTPIALTVPFALLVACAHGGSPVAPEGWRPVAGASAAWSSGTGARRQEYRYFRTQFGGTLQDLASSVTIDVLLHYHGAKLAGTVPFAPCPGAAGVATFALAGAQTLEEGFTVRNDQSVRTIYARPAPLPVDPKVTDAMQSALCIAPA